MAGGPFLKVSLLIVSIKCRLPEYLGQGLLAMLATKS